MHPPPQTRHAPFVQSSTEGSIALLSGWSRRLLTPIIGSFGSGVTCSTTGGLDIERERPGSVNT
jgi:hypothetical protein